MPSPAFRHGATTVERALPETGSVMASAIFAIEIRARKPRGSRQTARRVTVSVVAECYVAGVSTRRVDHLVQMLGIEKLSKSPVSEMEKSLTRPSQRSGIASSTAATSGSGTSRNTG